MRGLILIFFILSVGVRAEILSFEEISRELSMKSKGSPAGSKRRSDETSNNKEGLMSQVLKTKKLKKELEQAKKKLDSYRYITKLQLSGPFIMKDSLINEADIIGARNELAIYATTTPRRVILTELMGSDIPKDAKIVCQVYTKYKRICGKCERLIINGKGHPIKAELYNRDGSACAIGEVSDDGEDYLIGVGISELAQGALSVAQSSTPTAYGNGIQNNTKNQLSEGLQNIGSEASDLFKEGYKSREPVVTLKKGSQVAVLFNEEVIL